LTGWEVLAKYGKLLIEFWGGGLEDQTVRSLYTDANGLPPAGGRRAFLFVATNKKALCRNRRPSNDCLPYEKR